MIYGGSRPPAESHWTNYGCFNPGISSMTGLSDAEQEAYLELVKSVFPNIPGALPWVRETRYGIGVTSGYPNWNTTATRYWPNMYYRPATSDFMTGRYNLFEPILWVRQNGSQTIMCNPCPSPNYFGRNSSGANVVANADNTWRRDIRLNLERLIGSDVGTIGGEPYVSRAKYTNYRNMMVSGPNEIDHWNNARLYYLADGEVPAQSTSLATTNPATPAFDIYDTQIIDRASFYGHPSPRILKAQIWWESNVSFDVYAISGDTPCGIPSGWSSAESRSFGLFQVTPACGEGGVTILPNGHPNIMQNTGDPLWATSVFNPAVNIDLGVNHIAGGYNYFTNLFPSCSQADRVLMAAAGYVQDWATVTGCDTYSDQRQRDYVNAILGFYEQHWGTYPA